MMLHSLTEKTGLVAGIAVVDSENDVMIITDDGVIIRTGVEEIPRMAAAARRALSSCVPART